jgi:surfeit locus 1 family protein
MNLLRMLSRKWLMTTLLVLAGSAICVRLGIWQLDRLEQRRAFNAQVGSMRAAVPVVLGINIPKDISTMEWRKITVTGRFDFENQVAIRNQYNGDQYGYHLITPLLFDEEAVLVDRGWVPADGNSDPQAWRKYDQTGLVNLAGQIRLGQGQPAFGGVPDPELSPGQKRLDIWNNLDLGRIAKQIPYPVLSVYIQPDAGGNDFKPPIPFQPVLDLSEGPHFGYALQWFSFAAILIVGYFFYFRKQESI